jgi:hypothetical protein
MRTILPIKLCSEKIGKGFLAKGHARGLCLKQISTLCEKQRVKCSNYYPLGANKKC